MQEHYDEFFEVSACWPGENGGDLGQGWVRCSSAPVLLQEVFTEMEEKYGEVEEMNVCDNLGDHLVGNVYVKVQTVGCCGLPS